MVRKILEAAGIESAAFEARQIEAAGLSEEAAHRRAAGEPLQYILGEWDFFGRTFKCQKGVLIPRPETEQLIETALEYIESGSTVADLGCGTGCIAITAALERDCTVTMIDVEDAPLALAAKNAKLHGVDGRATVLRHSIFDEIDMEFDVIISNPPYIVRDELASLQKEVLHEPIAALDGGVDGLDFYRAIAEIWAPKARRLVALEVGIGQAEEVAQMLAKLGKVEIKNDYFGIARMVICNRQK